MDDVIEMNDSVTIPKFDRSSSVVTQYAVDNVDNVENESFTVEARNVIFS